MTLVRFFRADGTLDKEVKGGPGQRLLDIAWAAREPLEGACEGVMACSTCHVIVDPGDFEKLPPVSESVAGKSAARAQIESIRKQLKNSELRFTSKEWQEGLRSIESATR